MSRDVADQQRETRPAATGAISGRIRRATRTIARAFTPRKRAEETLRESEERYRTLVETITQGIEEIDTSGVITFANAAHHRQYEYSDGELIGMSIFDIVPTDSEADELREYLEYLLKEQPSPSPFVGQKRAKSGKIIDVEVAWTYTRDAEELVTGFVSIITDISERKRGEEALRTAHDELESRVQERTAELRSANAQLQGELDQRKRAEDEVRLLLTLTGSIYEASDFQSAVEVVLREVCAVTGWVLGEAWIPQPDRGVLEHGRAWYSSAADYREFRMLSDQITFPPGAGLPGRVWASRQPEWIQDLWLKPGTVFLRAAAAQEAGLKAGVGIPIAAGRDVLAVLVFFMSEPSGEDRRVLDLVSAVAQQLGGLIQRKRMEEQLQAAREELEGKVERQMLRRNLYGLTTRELTILHLVAAGKSDREIGGTLLISYLTAQKHISNILAKMGVRSRTEAAARAIREGLLE